MTNERFSKRQGRRLEKALTSVVLTQFSNPDRIDCPGTEVLQAIATKRISMRDPAIEHVAQCSPCLAELTTIRQSLRRRKVLRASGTGASVLILAVLLTYFAFRRADNRTQPGQPSAEVGSTTGGRTAQGGPLPPALPAEPRLQTALLDLRNASVTRSIQRPGSGSNRQPIEIPRGNLALMVYLPIGSEAGLYEVEIRKPNQPASLAGKGQATIERGITKLPIDIDTSSIQPGEYEFAWRPVDFDWRDYPILIR